MLKTRHKIFLGIVLALILSVVLRPFVQPPKQNKHIPTNPVAMNILLFQASSGVLRMKSIALRGQYPSDYQSEFDSNYYTITLMKGDKTLFTGKTVRSYTIISEEFDGTPHGETSEIPLGDFELNLPYYKDATTLVMTEDTGREVLHVDLTQYPLTPLPVSKQYCGDGICADNENLLMCFSDCSYRMNEGDL